MAAVLINGKNYDWNDLKFTMFGLVTIGITEINFSRKRASKNNYGSGPEPISFGYENFEYEGDVTLYQDEVRSLLLASPNNSILEIPPFTSTLIYSGNGVNFATDILNNIRFTEDVFSAKQNDSALTAKFPFIFAGLIRK